MDEQKQIEELKKKLYQERFILSAEKTPSFSYGDESARQS